MLPQPDSRRRLLLGEAPVPDAVAAWRHALAWSTFPRGHDSDEWRENVPKAERRLALWTMLHPRSPTAADALDARAPAPLRPQGRGRRGRVQDLAEQNTDDAFVVARAAGLLARLDRWPDALAPVERRLPDVDGQVAAHHARAAIAGPGSRPDAAGTTATRPQAPTPRRSWRRRRRAPGHLGVTSAMSTGCSTPRTPGREMLRHVPTSVPRGR